MTVKYSNMKCASVLAKKADEIKEQIKKTDVFLNSVTKFQSYWRGYKQRKLRNSNNGNEKAKKQEVFNNILSMFDDSDSE